MSLESRITEAAAAAVSRLDEEFRARLAGLSEELRAAAAAAGADAEAARATAEAAHAEVADSLAQQLAAVRAELDERTTHLAALEAQAHAVREAHDTELAQLRHQTDATLAEAERALVEAMQQAEQQHEQGRAAALLESTRMAGDEVATHVQALAHAVSSMDEASSLSEVLDALSEGLQSQAPRSAVLVFQEDRARVWRRSGFPAGAPGLGTDLHLPDHADLQAILDGAAPALIDGTGDEAPVLGLAPLPVGQQGLAVPVAIGGQSAALVYADGEGTSDERLAPGWTDAVEILARHAARCLETLTAMRAAGYARTQRPAVVVPMPANLRLVQRATLETSMGDAVEQARRVARLLVSEIRLNREADVIEGRQHGDLGTRLGDDIARARRQYFQRVSDGLAGRDALFDEELVRTLANGDATLLRTGS